MLSSIDYKTVIICRDDLDEKAAQWMFMQLTGIQSRRHGIILTKFVRDYKFAAGDMPIIAGKRVYLLGLCYSLDVMKHFANAASYLMVIDHHEHNAENIQVCSKIPGFNYSFDTTKCTAELTHAYLFSDICIPWWLTYVSDASMEKWTTTRWRAFIAALNAMGNRTNLSLNIITGYTPDMIENFLTKGETHMKNEIKTMNTICQQAVLKSFHGHRVFVSFTQKLVKDVGIALMLEPDCAFTVVCTSLGRDNWRMFLRGDDTKLKHLGIDLSKIASVYGGIGSSYSSEFHYSGSTADLLEKR